MPTDDVPDGYTIIKLIGSGGSGRVYLAQQQLIGRHVALKLYSQDLGGEQERADFARECDAARQLSGSPCVVTLYEAGVAGGRPWIAMEHYPRGSLADLLRREGPVEPQVALTLGVKLADALRTLHAAGRYHGDIKPGNVLLTDGGDPVLADFGLSVIRQAGSSMTLDAFSPPYAAPERLLDNRYAASSEVWGLGAVLYELLTGVPPFLPGRGESLVSFARRVAQDPLDSERLSPAPPPLRDAVGRALAKSRDGRPTIDAFATELRAAQHELGWPDVPPPVTESAATTRSAATVLRRPPKPGTVPATKRRLYLVPAVAALMVLAVLVAAALIVNARRPGTRPGGVAQPGATGSAAVSPNVQGSPMPSGTAGPTGAASPGPVTPTATVTHGPAPVPTTGPAPPPARPLGFTVFGGGVSTSGDLSAGLTVRTPVNDYGDLRGVSVDAGVCNGQIDVDALIVDPGVPSAGYGFGIGPHGSVSGGNPTGWTLQLEWDGGRGGYYRRAVVLPDQAAQPTTTVPVAITAGRWFHVRMVTSGASVTASVDGTPLGTWDIGAGCGAPLLRVWGSAAAFKSLAITAPARQ